MAEIFAPKPAQGEPWDIAIIGSGPAALTAAIYTTRGAASTLIIGGEKWGGQLMLTTVVDNWPASPGILGPDLMKKMREHATMFGGEFLEKNAENIDITKKPFEVTAGGAVYKTHCLIIATGAETKWLEAPGIREFIGRGVSSCAPCDAPFFKGKKVAVVGGGDSAMEEAQVLTKYASGVTIIHRRDAFRASAAMQQKIFNEEKSGKVKILWDTEVAEVKGGKVVEKLVLKNNKDGTQTELAVDGIFIAIGHVPSTQIFTGKIELDEKGYVVVKDHTTTSVSGIFVAGDVHDYHFRQAITAAGFGCMAGMTALNYLGEIKAVDKQ